MVAHSMSLIAVQAGVGAHVIRTDVAAAEHALDVIAETSRKALTQTRSMLGLLRDEDDPGTPTRRCRRSTTSTPWWRTSREAGRRGLA